jgi:hypothetical protein
VSSEPKPTMADTEFTFRVGMALGRALTPQPQPTLPRLEPDQRTVQMWSEPDALGYRYLLTFEVRDAAV